MRVVIGMSQWAAQIERVQALQDRRELKESIAEVAANQIKRRINEEKRTPGGQSWDPWGPDYALTRAAHHSLLVDTEHMLEGIYGELDGEDMLIASDRDYSGYVNDRREFMGLSAENLAEIVRAIDDWAQQVVG